MEYESNDSEAGSEILIDETDEFLNSPSAPSPINEETNVDHQNMNPQVTLDQQVVVEHAAARMLTPEQRRLNCLLAMVRRLNASSVPQQPRTPLLTNMMSDIMSSIDRVSTDVPSPSGDLKLKKNQQPITQFSHFLIAVATLKLH